MNKYWLMLLFVIFIAGCTTEVVETDQAITFRVLSKGQTSGLTQQKYLVLNDVRELIQLWQIHTSVNPAPIPRVNFTNDMVIAVFMGEQRTGGYAIFIENIIEREKVVDVIVSQVRPKPGSSRIMMITQPHMIVAMPRSKKPVAFRFMDNPQ